MIKATDHAAVLEVRTCCYICTRFDDNPSHSSQDVKEKIQKVKIIVAL